jgi:hypothetical protein
MPNPNNYQNKGVYKTHKPITVISFITLISVNILHFALALKEAAVKNPHEME